MSDTLDAMIDAAELAIDKIELAERIAHLEAENERLREEGELLIKDLNETSKQLDTYGRDRRALAERVRASIAADYCVLCEQGGPPRLVEHTSGEGSWDAWVHDDNECEAETIWAHDLATLYTEAPRC